LSKDDGIDPTKARSDLVNLLRANPEITKNIVTIIESELRDLKDSKGASAITTMLTEAASNADVAPDVRDGILYYLTQTSPDVRQTILVRTIEELLSLENSRDATLKALSHISTEENVKMVMEWVDRQILTLSQAIFVLLYPDSSSGII